MPKYTQDFFSHNIPNWKKYLSCYINVDKLHFLEVGCFEGRATRWLCKNILKGKDCKITVIDSRIPDLFRENMKPYINMVEIKEGFSDVILREMKEKFDFIYIDGGHMGKIVLEDSILSWKLLKSDGILIWDDYEWNDTKHTFNYKANMPKPAIDCFLDLWVGSYILIHKGYQVIIKKVNDNNYRPYR